MWLLRDEFNMKRTNERPDESTDSKRRPTATSRAEECVSAIQQLSDENLAEKFSDILPTLKQIQSGEV